MRAILSFWAHLGLIVGGIFALVGGSMLAMSPFMSAKAAGFVWCGIMFAGIIVGGSWFVYDDQRWKHRRRIIRSLDIIDYYTAHLR